MFHIWTDESPASVYRAIATITSQYPDRLPTIGPEPVGDKVLVLGTHAFADLQARKVIPKNRTITSLRNRLWPDPEHARHHLFSYSPGVRHIDHGKHVDLLCDAALAYRWALTGSLEPKIGRYRYVPNFAEVLAFIEAQPGPVKAALDTETLGLDPYAPGAYIVSIQLSVAGFFYDADLVTFKSKEDYDHHMAGPLGQQLRRILTHPKVKLRMANGKYDFHWLHVHGGFECSNFSMDTTSVGSVLDENRSNALNVHTKVYAPLLGGYDDPMEIQGNKARMDLELARHPDRFLTYSGGDTHATLLVADAQAKELGQSQNLARFYSTILHPALRAFEKIEQHGVCVDRDAFGELETKLHAAMADSITKIKEIAGGRLVLKHADAKKFMGLNPTKAAFLCDFMFGPKGLNLKPKMFTESKGSPSTAMEHMEMFADHPEAAPFITALSEYADAAKTLSTFVEGFLAHVRSDGRMHPTYWLHVGDRARGQGGANTGRLSCRDPAFQVMPKHGKWAEAIRRCYIAPPGYLVAEFDFSQGELRVVACIAHEPSMLDAYKRDMDVHVLTGGAMAGLSYAEMLVLKTTDPLLFKHLRQLAKAVNFGLLYGMSATGFDGEGGLRLYAKNSYGVTLTEEQAEDYRAAFFVRYPGLLDYHRIYKDFARKHGYVASPLGRVRHLPLITSPDKSVRAKAERQAVNSPVQSTLSDMMIWALARAWQQGRFVVAPTFGMIHDAKYVYVPEDNWEDHVRIERDIMESLPFASVGWEPELRFPADAKVGPSMGELEEVAA